VAFLEYLQRESKAFNLTAITDMREMVLRHVIDALAPFTLPDSPIPKERDGAGGTALRWLMSAAATEFRGSRCGGVPEWRVALLESQGKKAEFLRRAPRKSRLTMWKF